MLFSNFNRHIFIFVSQEMYMMTHTEVNQPELLEAFDEKFHMDLPFKNQLNFESEVISFN